jgi:hypothetical protein
MQTNLCSPLRSLVLLILLCSIVYVRMLLLGLVAHVHALSMAGMMAAL